jgi:hypothetical protein
LYDDVGDDVFVGTRAYSYLSGRNYLNLASGFQRVEGHGGQGGYDRGYLVASMDADTLHCQGSTAALQTNAVELVVDVFDEIAADLAGGNDVVELDAIDFLFSQHGTL